MAAPANCKKTASLSMPIPNHWPPEIRRRYDPVRVLGEGGFGSVILARVSVSVKKDEQESPQEQDGNLTPGSLVAVKTVGATSKSTALQQQRAYGLREIQILRAISHPNIIECLDSNIENMIIVLNYAKGPNVLSLIEHGGALSTIFGRVVIAQMVDAVAYLHSHAIIHRDIKPDNIIVTGATSTQNEIWDNAQDVQEGYATTAQSPEWSELINRWHVTLIDFDFARALTPEDVLQPSINLKRENMDASYHGSKLVDLELDKSKNPSRHSLGFSLHGSQHGTNRSLGSSFHGSRHTRKLPMLHRQMSALGNHQFAAPEIKHGVKNKKHAANLDVPTETISDFVADYGLLVDAYSVGCTIRYMMTGCSPHKSVSEAIAEQQNIIEFLLGCFCRGKKSHGHPARKRRFRYTEDLPGEVHRLITNMTERDESQRTSVRSARRYHWIEDVLPLGESKEDSRKLDDPANIRYLDFATTTA